MEKKQQEEEFKMPKILHYFFNRKRIWVISTIFFALIALYAAWEQKDCSLSYNQLAQMYNNGVDPISYIVK